MNVKDFLGESNTLGIDIWEKKYRFEDESFEEFLDRITGGNEKVKDLIKQKKFMYAGRILANRKLNERGIKVTLSNCYVLPQVEDSIESIWDVDYKLARTLSYGGGAGIDVSKISPDGAVIRNAAKTTSGVVSFMEQFAHTTARISQNGRRGALMLSLDVNHPDIEEFISVKGDLNKIVSANISIRLDSEFMHKVVNDLPHKLTFTRKETGQVIEKEVNAKQLFWRLAKMNWRTAEPGLLFWDNVNNWSLLNGTEDFFFAGTNPCGEQPLPEGGSCLLASINLGAYVLDSFTDKARFDFDSFAKDIPTYVEEMNIVLDEGLPLHPLQVQRDSVTKWRQIGLGVMNIAGMFVYLGMEYGSNESIELSDKIGNIMAKAAIKASSLLAKEHGPYPGFSKDAVLNSPFFKYHQDEELYDLVSKYGLRNSQLLTIAPTGSISTYMNLAGGGIEPIFALKFFRTTKSLHGKDVSYEVYSDIVQQLLDAKGITEVPSYVVTSMDLDYHKRIKMQATWQKHIDAAISSTINLPNETTVDEVFDIYVEAWKAGLKGCTVYRAGCEREGILTVEKDDEEMHVTNDDTKCPDCGGELVASAGCYECHNCGWGKCAL
jgi:ribonucleoside-diphosphate reductase alpha chain